MTQIVIDESMAQQLENKDSLIEIRSPDGRLLGHFVPAVESADPMYGCPHSPEELKEIFAQEGGRPLADIWKELGQA